MIPIVFSTDHNYVMPTGVTISSLLINADGETYDIYLMVAADVDDADREKLTRQVKILSPDSQISFVDMMSLYDNAHEVRGISKATYYRLMIPWLIPHIDKIIYADVDIIFKTSLRDIYETDLGSNILAGCQTSPKEAWAKYKRYFDRIGVDYASYFNAGVLLINSKLQRELNLDKEYNRLAEQKFLYQDQDILNIVSKGRAAYFPRRYNLLPQLYGTSPEYRDNVVIHYAGEKPWDTFTYAWVEWWDIYNRTIFKEERYYHDICRRILNPAHQVELLKKKAKIKMQILARKLK